MIAAAPIDMNKLLADSLAGKFPDARGRFGPFGGRYVPETLIPALEALEQGVQTHLKSAKFQARLHRELASWVGRPTALTYAARLSKAWNAQLWLKREDLAHTGAHKINNTVGQMLLARRMGKQRIVAETGAGQHGIATAVVGSLLRFPTEVYMGSEDVERQKLNVFRMELSGAKVIPVDSGSRTLKDAINDALRDWISNVDTTHYLIGSSMGPHPYPMMVKHFQTVIGKETKEDILKKDGELPEGVIACVGVGSYSIGIF